jgi:hypothetical protein
MAPVASDSPAASSPASPPAATPAPAATFPSQPSAGKSLSSLPPPRPRSTLPAPVPPGAPSPCGGLTWWMRGRSLRRAPPPRTGAPCFALLPGTTGGPGLPRRRVAPHLQLRRLGSAPSSSVLVSRPGRGSQTRAVSPLLTTMVGGACCHSSVVLLQRGLAAPPPRSVRRGRPRASRVSA